MRNADLWMELDQLASSHKTTWMWTRGHAGHEDNTRCDWLAQNAAATQRSSWEDNRPHLRLRLDLGAGYLPPKPQGSLFEDVEPVDDGDDEDTIQNIGCGQRSATDPEFEAFSLRGESAECAVALDSLGRIPKLDGIQKGLLVSRVRWQPGCNTPRMPSTKKGTKTILVTGATGHQGGASLRHLREISFPVRALTREPDLPRSRGLTGSGVEVVRGDMDDRTSLLRAMEETYGVHSVQNSHGAGISGEIRQGTNVADAAKASGVTHFVYSSVASADQRTGIPHFDSKFRIEEHIRGTGMHFTVVRPVFFMENWLGMRQMIEEGAIRLPLEPGTRLQMIAVDDIGGVVAQVFLRPGQWQNRVFEVAGDELSMSELAQAFGRASAREVRYVQIPWDEFEQQAGSEIATMYRWFQEVGYHVDLGAVRQEHHRITSFEHWMNANWHTAVRTA